MSLSELAVIQSPLCSSRCIQVIAEFSSKKLARGVRLKWGMVEGKRRREGEWREGSWEMGGWGKREVGGDRGERWEGRREGGGQREGKRAQTLQQ